MSIFDRNNLYMEEKQVLDVWIMIDLNQKYYLPQLFLPERY
jgi:hypothetical protein